jgi:hypothetical protein
VWERGNSAEMLMEKGWETSLGCHLDILQLFWKMCSLQLYLPPSRRKVQQFGKITEDTCRTMENSERMREVNPGGERKWNVSDGRSTLRHSCLSSPRGTLCSVRFILRIQWGFMAVYLANIDLRKIWVARRSSTLRVGGLKDQWEGFLKRYLHHTIMWNRDFFWRDEGFTQTFGQFEPMMLRPRKRERLNSNYLWIDRFCMCAHRENWLKPRQCIYSPRNLSLNQRNLSRIWCLSLLVPLKCFHYRIPKETPFIHWRRYGMIGSSNLPHTLS